MKREEERTGHQEDGPKHAKDGTSSKEEIRASLNVAQHVRSAARNDELPQPLVGSCQTDRERADVVGEDLADVYP